MEKIVKIGEIQAEDEICKNKLKKVLENCGFLIAEYPENVYEDWLVILEKRQ